MNDLRNVIRTSMSVAECEDTFRHRAGLPLIGGKGLLGKLMKSGQKQEFFEPDAQEWTDDGSPVLTLGSLFEFALDTKVAIQMNVWDREGTRTVELIVPYELAGRGGADRLISRFTEAFHLADRQAQIGEV